MDGAREVDPDDPDEQVSARTHFASSGCRRKHMSLPTSEDAANELDMPQAAVSFTQKMARAKAAYNERAKGRLVDTGARSSTDGQCLLGRLNDPEEDRAGRSVPMDTNGSGGGVADRLLIVLPQQVLTACRARRGTSGMILVAVCFTVMILWLSVASSARPSSRGLCCGFVAAAQQDSSRAQAPSPSPSTFVIKSQESALLAANSSRWGSQLRPEPSPPTRSASPPLPAPPPPSMAARLNARYRAAEPSSNLSRAGILIHQLDGIDLGELRDDFGRLRMPWMPCPATGMTWCSDIGDRVSASIINARLPYLFSDVAAGFLVSPQAKILCSFPKDGGTMPYTCTKDEPGCVPGCYGPGRVRTKCDNLIKGCYDPLQLQSMLEDQAHVQPDKCDRCSQGNGCRYNEIVLDAAAWVRGLPHTIEGIFFPRGGDIAAARRIHKQFVDHFGLDASALPFLQLDIERPEEPFETAVLEDPGLPIPPAYALTSTRCRAMLSDPLSKFWTLWGLKAWEKLPNGAMGCWNGPFAGSSYFDHVLSGGQCDANWFEGAKGALGQQASRPRFTAAAPALLGFDDTIFSFCSAQIDEPVHFVKTKYTGDFNEELAERCERANQNILRVISKRLPWTMCQNLRWQVCALTGKLPGQGGNQVRFATAPNELDMRVWQRPDSWPCDEHGKCPKGKFAVGDVFFAEVCLVDSLCRNGDAIFALGKGELFECDFDPDAFLKLADDFRKNVPIKGGCPDWYDSSGE